MTLDYYKCWTVLNELESVTSKLCSAREILESAIIALENDNKDKAESLMYATDEFLQYYLKDFDSKFKDAWNEIIIKFKESQDSCFSTENKLNIDWKSFYYPEEEKYQGSLINSFGDDVFSSTNSDLENFDYSDEEIDAVCDTASSDEEKQRCREYNLREAEYYDKRAKLDINSTYDDMIASGYTMTDDGFWWPPQKKDEVVKWRLPVEIDDVSGDYYFTLPDDLLEKTGWKEDDPLYWVDNGDGSFTLTKETNG